MSDELKPCPIPSCGGVASYEETEDGDHYVECIDCGYCGKSSMSFDVAVDWWNHRPIEDALRAEVERLQAELEKYVTPLTDEQAEHLASYHDNTAANWRYLDGEIRAAREGER